MRIFSLILLSSFVLLKGWCQQVHDTLRLADPTIFFEKGTYYLYGTSSRDGFLVYTSSNLTNWLGPAGKRNGHALLKGESFGTMGFWAPQIFKHNSKYYMAYTANEKIAIAESDDPLGPFTQKIQKAISGVNRQIDPYIFKDTDGSLYLYHVRVDSGNRIFVARLNDDLSDIRLETAVECIKAVEPWENTDNAKWPVAEGPTVVKQGKLYFLFYSANDFRNINYAVGYATSNSPMGPWKKYAGSPIISRNNTSFNGTGHGDLFIGADRKLYYVLHTHATNQSSGRRKSAIINVSFSKSKNDVVEADPSSFRFLLTGPASIIKSR
jgi:xylan 1,4-beta-xylosidase